MEVFETLVPVGIVLLCIAGIAALVALTYFLVSLVKTIRSTMVKVDAANLEIMRVDQILEDVNTITGNVSKATGSIDTITSVPLDAISTVTGKIRKKIAPLMQKEDCLGAVANSVDQKLDNVEDCVAGAQARADVKRAERDEAVATRNAAQDHANNLSSNLKGAFTTHISADAENVK